VGSEKNGLPVNRPEELTSGKLVRARTVVVDAIACRIDGASDVRHSSGEWEEVVDVCVEPYCG
jgi:hypothetical protein